MVSFRRQVYRSPEVWTHQLLSREEGIWLDALGFESSKEDSTQSFVSDPQRKGIVVLGLLIFWQVSVYDLLLLFCAWNSFLPLIKFSAQIINLPPHSSPWPPQVKLVCVAFLEYCMHISIHVLVTLYYSYLFTCLSSFPARLLTS